MAITLGRDCTLTVGGSTVVEVRQVTADETVTEQEFTPYGSRESHVYPTAYGLSVSFETIDDSQAGTFASYAENGTEVAVAGTGFSFTGVVTSISENQNLDGVRTISVTIKRTYSGLR